MALLALKALRKKHNITQTQLAEKLNLDTSSIAKYETTATMPSADVLIRIAGFFGVTTDYLLGLETPKEPSGFYLRNTEDDLQHINDDEALEYLEELHKRPEMKMLFKVSRKANKADIEKTVAIIEVLRSREDNSDG